MSLIKMVSPPPPLRVVATCLLAVYYLLSIQSLSWPDGVGCKPKHSLKSVHFLHPDLWDSLRSEHTGCYFMHALFQPPGGGSWKNRIKGTKDQKSLAIILRTEYAIFLAFRSFLNIQLLSHLIHHQVFSSFQVPLICVHFFIPSPQLKWPLS